MASRPRKKKREYRIFISHATADKWIAKVICDKLEALGATTFRDDRDIQGGEEIPATIRGELRRADEVLVLLTPQSANRPWVQWEAATAWGFEKLIVVIQYHVDIVMIPPMLQSRKAMPLGDFDNYLAEVGRRLEEAI